MVKYAWRLIDAQGRETSILVTLSDDADVRMVNLVRRAAARQGVTLKPVYPPDLQVERTTSGLHSAAS